MGLDMDEHTNWEEAKNLNEADKNDDIMERIIVHVGEMGTYQRLLFIAMLPFGMIYAFVYCVQMFVAATPQNHWCLVPDLQHLNVELRRNLSIPGAVAGKWERCSVFDANWTEVLQSMTPPHVNTSKIPCQHGWEFSYDDIPYATVVSEREWICEKASYGPIAQAFFFLGSLVGCGLFGWVGDAFGRIPALMGANLIGFVGGVATIFTRGIWDFAFCRFLVGMANDYCFIVMYILILEYVGPKHRTWVANVSIALFFTSGAVLLPFLALWLLDWKKLVFYTTLPMLIVLVAPWALPESARWLVSTGKVDKAVKTLKRFEKINGTKIPEDVLQNFIISSNKKCEIDESLVAAFQSPALRNSVIVLTVVSTLSVLGIDNILRMSENIGDSFFVTFAWSSAAEIPALTLVALILDKLGRRSVSSAALAIAGSLSFVCAFVSQGTMQLVLAVVIRFFINMSISVQMQLSSEMLPTGVRASGTALLHVSAYVVTIVSPFLAYSAFLWRPLPLVVIGALGLVSSGLSLLLPETTGKPMPQTIAEAEIMIRETALCGKVQHDPEEMIYLPLKKNSNSNRNINKM